MDDTKKSEQYQYTNNKEFSTIKIDQALEVEDTVREMNIANESPDEEVSKKKDLRTIGIMVAVLIGIIFFSLGGIKLSGHFTAADVIDVDYLHKENWEGNLDEDRGYVYDGYSFVFVDGLWWTEMAKGNEHLKVPLHFGPNHVSEIERKGELDAAFNSGEVIYIAINPTTANKYYTLALSELNFNIAKGISRRPMAVCTEENAICEDREILSCNNTKGKPVVELAYGGEGKIEMDGTCILISGEEYDLVKAVDRLLLIWYGVMS